MKTKSSSLFNRFLVSCFAVSLIILPTIAQEIDPNPDSPTPILISEPGSIRALATDSRSLSKGLNRITSKAFMPGKNSKITLFVTNLALLPDEGANAFRFFIEDQKGVQYPLPVEAIKKVSDTVYAVQIRLYEPTNYWGQPPADGDVLGHLTWRGLTSNQVKIGLGTIGGKISDPDGAVPTPLNMKLPVKSNDEVDRNYVGYRWSGDRQRFIEQATFGSNSDLDWRIRRIGLRSWVNEQFQENYPSLTNPYPNIPLKPVNAPADCDGEQVTVPDVPTTCQRDTYSQYLTQNWFLKEAFYGTPQLKHRVSWALAQIWVTSGVDIQQSSHIIRYHQILSQHAFGNWRDLMRDMTLNPTMGDYLDMVRSTRTSPNENYPREILQLFNIGLFALNPDGTVQIDGQGVPVASYDQTTVNNFTKVFTGWGFCNVAASCPNIVAGTLNFKDPMLLNRNNHDLTTKTLFSYPGSTTTNIAACTGCTGTAIDTYANNSLNQALDNIFNHPNVPPFVSRLLIQQLVTAEPTPAYVQRVANVFANNGSGVRGDMKSVIRAILFDPEARGNNKTDPRYGKLREPVLLATNVLRNFNVMSADGLTQSDGYISPQLTNMGQNPFRSPTVFNYYPPDYIVPGSTMNSPEFAILTTGTTIQRSNFFNTMVYSRINGGSTNAPFGTSINLTALQALVTADPTGNRLLDELNNRMMHGTMPTAMRNSILTAVAAATTTLAKTQAAIYLVATSSQYQIQR